MRGDRFDCGTYLDHGIGMAQPWHCNQCRSPLRQTNPLFNCVLTSHRHAEPTLIMLSWPLAATTNVFAIYWKAGSIFEAPSRDPDLWSLFSRVQHSGDQTVWLWEPTRSSCQSCVTGVLRTRCGT